MTTTSRGRPFKPGQSGNPAGRPPGAGEVGKLRASISRHVPEIIKKLVEQAKGGDATAARLLLERVLPPVKAVEQAASVALNGDTLTEQGRAVLAAAAQGELAPSQAAQLLSGLGSLAKLVETDELTKRIEELERAHGKS